MAVDLEKMAADLQYLRKAIDELKTQREFSADTSLIDINDMATEMKCSVSGFRNRLLPKLMAAGIVKKYGGRYKAFRRDFEMYKLNP
jgi:hypothetical protein